MYGRLFKNIVEFQVRNNEALEADLVDHRKI